jgi:GAF domain-containing protein
MDDSLLRTDWAVGIVGRIDAMVPLLEVVCDMTGMRFAAVVRVTDQTWTVCALKDHRERGLKPGDELPLDTAFLPSYVAAPIILGDGRFFGNLCAVDHESAVVAEPRILSIFNRFASLVAVQLDSQLRQERRPWRCSMRVRPGNFASNSSRSWVMIYVIPCMRSS